jgi:glycosyltransferase involved in cell wall biosynthesis
VTITGMVRVKNGGRWLRACLDSLLAICSNVLALDDRSTDDTREILDDFFPRVHYFVSSFIGLNEARDKNFLLQAISNFGAVRCAPDDLKHQPQADVITKFIQYTFPKFPKTDWVVAMDADEALLDPHVLLLNIQSGRSDCYATRTITLWDSPSQIRVDGIYGGLWRAGIFKLAATDGIWRVHPGSSNLHCGSVPYDIIARSVRCSPEARVAHYGSMLKEDRVAKYEWYLANDTNNMANEDYYRHAVQGDLPQFPADAVFKHGGPLRLQEWEP